MRAWARVAMMSVATATILMATGCADRPATNEAMAANRAEPPFPPFPAIELTKDFEAFGVELSGWHLARAGNGLPRICGTIKSKYPLHDLAVQYAAYDASNKKLCDTGLQYPRLAAGESAEAIIWDLPPNTSKILLRIQQFD